MSNDIIKKHDTKARLLKVDVEALKDAWFEKEKKLCEEKVAMGYGAQSIKDFLAIEIEDDIGQAEASNIIMLQNAFRSLEEERSILWIEDDVVNELNQKHAVMHTDQFYILTEKEDFNFGGKNFVLESKASFKSQYENKQISCPDGKMKTKAEIWLKSSSRREYINITFDPATDPKIIEAKGLYNIWKGFAKEPKQGSASLYWDHVRDNICAKNPSNYLYLRKWLASIFQHPDRVHTALVLCGTQGVGKNSFVNPLGVLLGLHYAPLGNVYELVSHFNFHLKNAVLIHANESFWGGHRKEIGILKAMITEETCLIEAKGKDRILVRNYKHVIMSSNEDWPVHLDRDDRRFFVLRVSEEHKEDHEYFKALDTQLTNGGYEALLYDLLNEDLTDFDPRKIPASDAAFDIKLRSSTSAEMYIYEALLDGSFYIGIIDDDNRQNNNIGIGVWQSPIPKKDVYDDHVVWCRINGHKAESNNQFGMTLKKLIPSTSETRRSIQCRRVREYTFPSLEQARKEFCKAFKETERIWDDTYNSNDEL